MEEKGRWTRREEVEEERRDGEKRREREREGERERNQCDYNQREQETVLLTIIEFKNPLLNMSNVHVELTSSCNL